MVIIVTKWVLFVLCLKVIAHVVYQVCWHVLSKHPLNFTDFFNGKVTERQSSIPTEMGWNKKPWYQNPLKLLSCSIWVLSGITAWLIMSKSDPYGYSLLVLFWFAALGSSMIRHAVEKQ